MSENNKDQEKTGEEEIKDLFDKSLEDGTIDQADTSDEKDSSKDKNKDKEKDKNSKKKKKKNK